MSINNPIANTINTGHATATIPANASNIIAKMASIKIIKHKVIINIMPPFFIIEAVKFSKTKRLCKPNGSC